MSADDRKAFLAMRPPLKAKKLCECADRTCPAHSGRQYCTRTAHLGGLCRGCRGVATALIRNMDILYSAEDTE